MDTALRQPPEMATPDVERRRTRRLRLQLPAAVFLRGAMRYVPFILRDISMTGAFLSSEIELGAGDRFVLSIRPPGTACPIVAQARVVRVGTDQATRSEPGLGVVFTGMSPESYAVLAGLWRSGTRTPVAARQRSAG